MRSAKTNTLKDTQSESRHSKDLHDLHKWYRSHNWARYRRWHKHHRWKLQTQRLEIALQESKIKLKALNDDLPFMGECTVTIETKPAKLKHLLLWYKEWLTLYLYSEDQAPAAVSAVATTSPGPAKPQLFGQKNAAWEPVDPSLSPSGPSNHQQDDRPDSGHSCPTCNEHLHWLFVFSSCCSWEKHVEWGQRSFWSPRNP